MERVGVQTLNKRGSADLIFLVITIFAFAIIILVGFKSALMINNAIQGSDFFDNSSKSMSSEMIANRMPNILNYGFITVLVLLWISLLVITYVTDIHPAFLVVGLIIGMFIMFMIIQLANVYLDISASSALATEASQFTIITWVMQHIIPIGLIIIFSVLVVAYAKARTG